MLGRNWFIVSIYHESSEHIIFLFVNSNENNLIYLLLADGKEEQMNFVSELFTRASCSHLRSFVHHVVRDVKLNAQEKLFVLATFNSFIGLCRVSLIEYMELLDKKLTGPGPDISVHLGVTLSFSFFYFIIFFVWHISWPKTVKLHALQRNTLHKRTDFPPLCN